ncbi:uncharacterized protein EV420DRAFT_1484956 [Desarmillaria tabescens]|uniref:Uncharacterized protein n=1 Tax=Armillaria tabescens TaxID=1929756 RepID=A0AA39MQK4_ARMTA|nr:uncharacterized protein EV420DRAFT_1484956 [Desarmillaria tabescens]KAK0443431.1 hypothetical protein EV420DRAFT_1484956 [Desarmillaria tabescens]
MRNISPNWLLVFNSSVIHITRFLLCQPKPSQEARTGLSLVLNDVSRCRSMPVSVGIEGALICHDAQNVVPYLKGAQTSGGQIIAHHSLSRASEKRSGGSIEELAVPAHRDTYTAVDYRMTAVFIWLLTGNGMSVYRPSLGKLFRQTERVRYPYDGTRITVLYGNALSALLSAIQLADDQASSTSSDDPTSSITPSPGTVMSSSPLPTKKSSTGVIVGSVVSGLAVLAANCGRRHRSNNESHSDVDNSSPRMLTPFMATSIPVSSEISRESRMNQKKNARYTVGASRAESSSSSGLVERDPTQRRMDIQTELTSTLTPPNPPRTESRENMPTEELLRLLNERLQPGRWNVSDDELPPEYHEGRTT